MTGVDHLMVAAFIADLEAVAIVQVARQTCAGHAASHGFDDTDGQSAMVDAVRINDARVLAAQSIAVHQAAAGENLLEAVHFRLVRLAESSVIHRIDALTVAGCDGRHIFRALQTAFQLDGARTRLHQLRQMIAHAHIARAEPGSRLAAIGIGQTAGLGAAASITAAAADHGGKQALSADRDALGAMAEDLDLNAHIGSLADLAQRTFPGQHRAGQAMTLDEAHAGSIMQRHLGRGMDGQVREAGAGQVHHAQVLHEDGVHLHLVEQPQHIHDARQLTVLDEGIDRHMHADMVQVGKVHGFAQLLLIEIAGASPGGESSIAQIDRISARRCGPVEGFPVTCRGQVF